MFQKFKYVMFYLSFRPWRTFFLVGLLLATACTEFVSLSLFVPIIEFIVQEGQLAPRNEILVVILRILDFIGIEPTLMNLLGVAFVGMAMQFITTFIQNSFTYHMFFPIRKEIRDRCFKNLMDTSLDYYSDQRSGSLINVMTERIDTVGYVINMTVNLMAECMLMLAYLAFVMMISWQVSLMVLGVAVLRFVFVFWFLRRSKVLGKNWLEDGKKQTSRLVESLQAVRLIKSFSRESHEKKRFSKTTKKYLDTQIDYAMNEEYMKLIDNLLAPLLVCIIIYVSIVALNISGSYVMVYILALVRMIPKMSKINVYRNQLSINLANTEAIIDLLDEKNKPRIQSGKHTIESIERDIAFEHVGFAYEEGKEVLKDLNFTIQKGQQIAIVGASGSGKSSLVNLILHLYDPTTGNIKVDGNDLREVDLSSWHNKIGFVDQDNFIFNESVLENIRYGLLDATREDVVAAAKKAHIHDVIEEMSDGYDTLLGERGLKLSGGQKQRLAIARSIIKKPEVLIFDEATSALDSISEEMIRQSIEEISRECTTILIAHRLSTIRDADRIIVLEDGQIVESGNHEELLAQNGKYKEYTDVQNHLVEVQA